MRTLITFYFVLYVGFVAAQNLNFPAQHDNIWISGYEENPLDNSIRHTVIDFHTFPPQVTEQAGDIDILITNVMMSDEEGELLFYSDGEVIQNSFGENLVNGDGIAPDVSVTQKLHEQTMLSVPYPDENNKFFMLHSERTWVLDDEGNTLDDYFAGTFKLYYTTILSDEEVLEKNVTILNDTIDFGKLTTCKHANGRDWWFLVPEYWSNKFYRYLLTPNGLDTLPIQTIGDRELPGLGAAVFTSDGSKYISTGSRGSNPDTANITIFDFDRCTGLLSNQQQLTLDDTNFGHPIAVSPSSQYLYFYHNSKFRQYDLWAEDIFATEHTTEGAFPAPFLFQLAPDGKIYMTSYTGQDNFHIINDPDFPEEMSGLEYNGFTIPNKNYASLPYFPNYRLGPIDGSTCDTLGIDNLPVANFRHETFTDTVYFRDLSAGEPTDWYWTFGDEENSSEKHNNHIYSSGGLYEVCLTVSNENGSDTWCDSVQILTTSAVEQQELSIESSIFPNPSDGLVLLQTEQNLPPDSHFKVYDQAGRLVFDKELQSGFDKQNIELYDLSNGMYFYEILLSDFVIGKGKLVIGR